MEGKCRLCDNERELRESHIIPSFVFKWLKESSGTGFIRFGHNPNLRIQDGPKHYLLCDVCEGLFSDWEKEFADSIFHPCHEGSNPPFYYGKWLLKFAVSVSWRVLNFIIDYTGLSKFPEVLREKANNALFHWKDFLLDKAPHPSQFEQHMLPLGSVKSFSNIKMPPNVNRYILRTIDSDAAFAGDKEAFVYSKMGRIVLVGFIEMPHPERWKGTKIHVSKGSLGVRKYSLPSKFGEYFFNRARESLELQASISAKQKLKIEESYREDQDRGINAESFKALDDDVNLFGHNAVFEEE